MKHVSRQCRSLLLAAMVLVLSLQGTQSAAQTFNVASLPEYPYPVPGTVIPGPLPNPVNVTTHTQTYTMSHMSYMTPAGMVPAPPPFWPPAMPYPAPPPPMNPWLSDLTVHCWDDPGSTAGLAWINKAWGSGKPGTIYDQGFMMYPSGVQDIEATIQQDQTGYAMPMWGTNFTTFVVVSFYNGNPANYTGAGHYVEVWQWNRPIAIGPGGLTFVNRVQLSGIPNYTRISQDGHNCYGFGITWEDPNPASPTFGIAYVMGFMNAAVPGVSISPVYALGATGGWQSPDIAFSHGAAGTLKLQFVYHRVNGMGVLMIQESDINFVLGPPWPFAAPPVAVNDMNFATPPFTFPGNAIINIKSCLDAPDHYGVDNWAYGYILPGIAPNDILVRFRNFNPPNLGAPATYNLTNGTLALPTPAAITGNDWPTLSFDATPSRINVGWYTTFVPMAGAFFAPNAGGYVDLQMDETGVVTSPMDYMQVGLASSGSNHDASATPSIAYSTQNDRTDYHYPVFANTMACPVAASQIQTKERPWTTAAFKGLSNEQPDWTHIYREAEKSLGTSAIQKAQNDIVAYPNPFTKEVALTIPPAMLDKEFTVVITDITGRELSRFTETGSLVNSRLSNTGKGLAGGTYLLNINEKTGDFKKVIKLEKLADK